jgi:hypothetical protein
MNDHKTGMWLKLVFCAVALVLLSCNKDRDGDSIPNCLDRRMDNPKNAEFDDIREVHRLKHNGKCYYLAISGCCDRYSYVYDSKCNQVCAPSGGFTGGGSGDCPDYIPADLSKYELVWKADN